MPISGIVIRIDPDQQAAIRRGLAQLPEVELQTETGGNLLVATLDTRDFASEQALTEAIAALPGVVNVTVAYHNFEDMADDLPVDRRCEA